MTNSNQVSNLSQDLERAQGEVMRLRKMLEETQEDAAEVEKRLKAQVGLFRRGVCDRGSSHLTTTSFCRRSFSRGGCG